MKGHITGVRVPSWAEKILSGAGFLLVVLGLLTTPLFETLQTPVVWHDLAIAGCLLASGCLVSCVCRVQIASGIAITIVVLLVRFLGLTAMAAAALVVGAALVIGEKVQKYANSGGSVVSVACGLSILMGVVGWLLPFHVHGFLLYFAILLGICYAGRARLRRALSRGRNHWKRSVSSAPMYAAFTLLVVAVASTSLVLPTLVFDDLSYHMLLPTELLTLGRYKMDAASQIWALAPWGSDVLQGYITILCGHLVRGMGQACWFAMTLFGIWQLGRVVALRAQLRWLSVAAFASLPLLASMNASMQADVAIAASTVALVVVVAWALRFKKINAVVPFVLISALLVSLKTTQALLILPLALVMAVAYGPWQFIKLSLRALPIAVMACMSSYIYAWYITGNPVFPLFNGIFKSPFGPAQNFDDLRWHQGLHWDSLWQITFHTDKFQEAYPGALGFIFLGLFGCVLISFWKPRLRWISLSLMICMVGIFLGIQYVRYIVPAMAPLFSMALVVWQDMRFSRTSHLGLVGLISLNIVFMPTSSYIFMGDIPWQVLSNINRANDVITDNIYKKIVPEVLVRRYLSTQYGSNYFVYLADPERPFEGVFEGKAITFSSYDPTFFAAARDADTDSSGSAWITLFARAGIDHVLLYGGESASLRKALLRMRSIDEYSVGNAHLWRICGACGTGNFPLLEVRDIGHALRRRPSF